VNERISDLLDRASDDGGAPLGFSGDSVARRARSEHRRRQRYGGAAVVLAAASVAGIVVASTQLWGSSPSTHVGPVEGPSTKATPSAPTSAPSPSPGAALTPAEKVIVSRCSRLTEPADLEHPADNLVTPPDTEAGRVKARKARAAQQHGGVLPTWTLDAYVQDAQGVTATFVDPDHTRWASCDLADGGTDTGDQLVARGRLPHGPIPQNWYGPDGFRHQDTEPEWAQVCSPGEGKVCARELFAGSFARYAGVASAVVDAPDGTVLHAVVGDYTYVFRHSERRVAPHRAPHDNQPLPSMPVTLLDDHGKRIIRYDYFPSYVVPASCPATGGC
jgi:hypothetical protein